MPRPKNFKKPREKPLKPCQPDIYRDKYNIEYYISFNSIKIILLYLESKIITKTFLL